MSKEVFRIIREIEHASKDYPALFGFLKKIPRRTWADIVLDFADKHAAAEILGDARGRGIKSESVQAGLNGDDSDSDDIPILSDVIRAPGEKGDALLGSGVVDVSEPNDPEDYEPIPALDEDEDDIEQILRESFNAIAKPGELPPEPLRKSNNGEGRVADPVSPSLIQETRLNEGAGASSAGSVVKTPIDAVENLPEPVSQLAFLDGRPKRSAGLLDSSDGVTQAKKSEAKKGRRKFNLDQLMS